MVEQPEVRKIFKKEFDRLQQEMSEFKINYADLSKLAEFMPGSLVNTKTRIVRGELQVEAKKPNLELGMNAI